MPPEAKLRAHVRMYLTKALPAPGFFSAIEHGRMHHGNDEQRGREWGRLKGQGVKTGLADVFIWHQNKFIAVELKAGKNTTSDSQDAFGDAMIANGFSYMVVHLVAELDAALRLHGIPVSPSMRVLAMQHDAALSILNPTKKPRAAKNQRAKPTARSIARRTTLQRQGIMV